MKNLSVILLLLNVISCTELGREYSISGNIYDPNDNPLQDAYCEFGDGNDSNTYSDENGFFSLSWKEDIVGGCPFLTVEMTGYRRYVYNWDCESAKNISNHVVKLEFDD